MKNGTSDSRSTLFLAGLWWVWRNRNLMCLNNETWSMFRLCNNIHSSTDAIKSSFQRDGSVAPPDRFIKWNCNNYTGSILNVDGSCLGTPIWASFGGVLCNSVGVYLSDFSGFIPNSNDILLAELTTIYHGLIKAIEMGTDHLLCYYDSLISIHLISDNTLRFHIYAMVIQDIKDMLASRNYSLQHTLREGNQCADYLTKLGASSDVEFITHSSPPVDLLPLLRTNASGIFFSRP
jgi:ribonuclease HI